MLPTNAASHRDTLSSFIVLSPDLADEIMNMCNNNHVLWECVIDQNVLFAFAIITSCPEEGSASAIY